MDGDFMNVCVTVNSKYMRYLYVMLRSLFDNNKKGIIKLYVINSDFDAIDENYIRKLSEKYGHITIFIKPNSEDADLLPQTFRENGNNYSKEILYRLMIPELLPQDLDRVIMLDADLIINKDIEPLYNVDFNGKLFAAAPNMAAPRLEVYENWKRWYSKERKNWIHYNTGVILWNLKMIREELPKRYIFKKAISSSKIEKPSFEEEFINVEFGEDNIKSIDFKWNWQPRVVFSKYLEMECENVYTNIYTLQEKCSIVHYVDMNPWGPGNYNFATELWWGYCKKTPFYEDLLLEYIKQNDILLNSTVDMYKKAEKIQDEGKKIINRLKIMGISSVLVYGTEIPSLCMEKVLRQSEINFLGFVEQNFYKREELLKCRNDVSVFKMSVAIQSEIDFDAILVLETGKCYDAIRQGLCRITTNDIVPIISLMCPDKFLTELERRVGRYAHIVIYGAGNNGRMINKLLKECNRYKICALVDLDYKKIGDNVLNPKILAYNNFDYVLISMESETMACEAKEYMRGIGVSESKIVWIPNVSWYF